MGGMNSVIRAALRAFQERSGKRENTALWLEAKVEFPYRTKGRASTTLGVPSVRFLTS